MGIRSLLARNSSSRFLHRRVRELAAERNCAESGAGDVEIEREMLARSLRVAEKPLQRIAGVDRVRAVAGPKRLYRLARLRDGEGVLRAQAKLGLQIWHRLRFGGAVECDRRFAHEVARRIDESARLRHLDLHGLEFRDLGAGVRADAASHGTQENVERAFGGAEDGGRERMSRRSDDRDAKKRPGIELGAGVLESAAAKLQR